MNKKKFIPLASPDINDEDISEVVRVLKTGMLVQGAEVEQLENAVASFIGVKHCVAVSNGTASLHLGLIAMGIGPGDEVIVPAFTYIATANVVELVGATPVFIDINIENFNIATDLIEQSISQRTKAIIVVHEFGLAADMEKIMIIADRHKLTIIEDAACALGATQNNRLVGSFGHLGSFSLHPRKAITSGEGGLITTDHDEIASSLKILRNHGIVRSDGKLDFEAAGYNYRMTDFQAALARSQFLRLKHILEVKKHLAEIYLNEISNPLVQLPSVPNCFNHTWQTFHVLLAEGIDQYKIIDQLKEKGIGTNYGAQCIPCQTYYYRKYKLNCSERFPNALKAFRKGLAIPLYEKLTENDIRYITQTINEITLN